MNAEYHAAISLDAQWEPKVARSREEFWVDSYNRGVEAINNEAYATATAQLPDAHRHEPAAIPLPPYHPDTPAFRRAWARYFDLIAAMDAWVGRILGELEDFATRTCPNPYPDQ